MYYVVRKTEYFVEVFDNQHDAEWFVETMLEDGIEDCKIIKSKQGIHEYEERMKEN